MTLEELGLLSSYKEKFLDIVEDQNQLARVVEEHKETLIVM